MKIPDGHIDEADKYMVLPNNSFTPITIGGKIMFNLVVKEQMDIGRIIATTGLGNKLCMIIVDYTDYEVMKFLDKANQEIYRLKRGGVLE